MNGYPMILVLLVTVGVSAGTSIATFALCEAYAIRRGSEHVTWDEPSGNLGLCQAADSEDDSPWLLCDKSATRIIVVDGQDVYVCEQHFIEHEEKREQASHQASG